MLSYIEYTAADRDFYAPLEHCDDLGDVFRPSRVPEDWAGVSSGVWTMWHRPDRADLVADGWKVHVSARAGRLAQVLDRVAEVCFEQAVPFKHLSTKVFYWWMHQKLAPRPQSGKFIAAYPADTAAARRLMERLRAELMQEDGPYILTDRRFKDSRTVYYRYGAFVPRSGLQADGTQRALVRDGEGNLVRDHRGVSFRLPDGTVDPFVEPASAAGRVGDFGGFGGFAIDSSVRHSNAGGTYRGRQLATGREVFIKEARPHVGLGDDDVAAPEQLRREWEVLTALHELAPGLAPEPVGYFHAWEHQFMAMEHVPGETLLSWVAVNHPLLRAGATEQDFADFYHRAEKIMQGVEEALGRLHAVGYLFVDVSPGNVLVGPDDRVRLVDFGAAHRLGGTWNWVGTPGYTPPPGLVGDDLSIYDDYGVAALAQHLLGPMHHVLHRNASAWAHVHYDLRELAPVPPGLWSRATRYRTPAEAVPSVRGGSATLALPRTDSWFPTPEQVAADPLTHLGVLRDRIADAILAMVDVDDPDRMIPTIPPGYVSNTTCVAYGAAGVVHALRRAGRELPPGLVDRLRSDAVDPERELPPGLYVGSAGLAWVLSDCGFVDEARDLLRQADRHPLTAASATLFGGAAGVGLTHLALYGRTHDQEHVERALALADALPADGELTPRLGADDAIGLMHGRCGLALFLQQLAGVTGDHRHLTRAVRLLHAELDRVTVPEAPGLLFPASRTDNRQLPYLFAGSAGMVYVASRCLRAGADARLTEVLPRMLAPLGLTYTIMPGLFQGLAGFAFTLADHAARGGDDMVRAASLRVARSLFKYAVPHPSGVRYLGDQLLRYSAELWSGSAGVLLALEHVLDPRPDALFTVDALIDADRQPAGIATTAVSGGPR